MNSSPAMSTRLFVAVSSQRECTRVSSIGVVDEYMSSPASGMPTLLTAVSPSPHESRTSVIWNVPSGVTCSLVLVIR